MEPEPEPEHEPEPEPEPEPSSSAAADEEVAPPAPLDAESIATLITTLEGVRSEGREVKEKDCFGWKITYSKRGPGQRGDMYAIDPRDGEKMQSIVGVKRKLGVATDPAVASARESRAPKAQRADPAASDSAVQEMLMMDPSQRRARKGVNYAEAAQALRGTGITRLTLSVLDEASPLPAEGEEQGEEEEEKERNSLDLGMIAELVHERGGAGGTVPYGTVRSSLMSLLKSGRARRILKVLPPPGSQPSEDGASSEDGGAPSAAAKVELALRYMVLNTLQVEADYDAPWSLQPAEERLELAVARRAAKPKKQQLVGRRIEVWWGGDKSWYRALISKYNEIEGQWLDGAKAGTHVVLYEVDGLRAAEDLDGPGEPKFWRLAGCEDWGSTTPPGKPGASAAAAAAAPKPAAAPAEPASEEQPEAAAAPVAAPSEAAEASAGDAPMAEADSALPPTAPGETAQPEAGITGPEEAAAGTLPATEPAPPVGDDALVKGLHPRRAVAGKRLVVDYEEEDASGVPVKKRYPGTALEYSATDGLLVAFDSNPNDAPTWVDEVGDDEWEWEAVPEPDPFAYDVPPRVESMISLATIRQLLPISADDANNFATPPGWEEVVDASARRAKRTWVELKPPSGKAARSFDRRLDLEKALERDAAVAKVAWLGTVAGGAWQLQQKAIVPALQHVLDGLIASGHVRSVVPSRSGKNFAVYLAANQYFRGEAFPRKSGKAVDDEEEEEQEDELAELEKQRLRNIERNQEMLRALGLA